MQSQKKRKYCWSMRIQKLKINRQMPTQLLRTSQLEKIMGKKIETTKQEVRNFYWMPKPMCKVKAKYQYGTSSVMFMSKQRSQIITCL